MEPRRVIRPACNAVGRFISHAREADPSAQCRLREHAYDAAWSQYMRMPPGAERVAMLERIQMMPSV